MGYQRHPAVALPLLQDEDWPMSSGERAALEGVLCQLTPGFAIAIATQDARTLTRIAAHSQELHSLNLPVSGGEGRVPPNVTVHSGDEHVLLIELLDEYAHTGRNVDFALVDGGYSSESVRRTMVSLLESAAVGRTVILVNDAAREGVRAGLEQVDYAGYPKVTHVEFDFVSGHMMAEPSSLNEIRGGLGLVVVGAGRNARGSRDPRQDRYHEAFELLSEARQNRLGSTTRADSQHENLGLRRELEETRSWLASIQGSASWRVTKPLRVVKRLLKRGPD